MNSSSQPLLPSEPTLRPSLAKAAALGGAAASAAVFALPTQADAAIIYSGPQNISATIGAGSGASSKALNLDGLGGADFHIAVLRQAFPIGTFGQAALFASSANLIRNASSGLQKLASGANISGGAQFTYFANLRFFSNGNPVGGTWASNQPGFAGVKFVSAGNTLYGWIQLKWTDSTDANPDPNTITAIDWAYNDTPGAPITAGATGAVPEPSSALLILAGAGTALMRRRRKQAA